VTGFARRASALAGALLLATGLSIAGVAPAEVAAAGAPGLTIVGDTRYEVLPAEHRVAVASHLTATNHLKDTSTRRFYFRTGFVSVLPGASAFSISGGSGKPKVSVSSRTKDAIVLKIDLGANLAAGRSTTLDLAFDLVDAGGPPNRPVRVSSSLVTFSAWAIATPSAPGGSVRVSLPADYHVTIGRGPLSGPTQEGSEQTWSSGTLANPLAFVADVAADRPSATTGTSLSLPGLANVPITVVVRAWPDDTAWRDRVATLASAALPLLARDIGAPWPLTGQLTVQETLEREASGAAGQYDPTSQQIDLGYAATDELLLKELARVWFNGRLVADRWIAEGFASYYARRVLLELQPDAVPTDAPAPSPDDVPPLNSWTGTESSGDSGSGTRAATYQAVALALATAIARRAGDPALQAIWSHAAYHEAPYVPTPNYWEQAPSPPDWRGLLDLLEDQTGESFRDLWVAWVARPEDVPQLAARDDALAAYRASVARAGSWTLPQSVREALRAWRFDDARALLDAANGVLDQRDQLAAAAAAAGLPVPRDLEVAFEGDAGLAAAATEGAAELATVAEINQAAAARPRTDDGAARSPRRRAVPRLGRRDRAGPRSAG
jgi:hypothetical protein